MADLKRDYSVAKLKNGQSGQSRHTAPYYDVSWRLVILSKLQLIFPPGRESNYRKL